MKIFRFSITPLLLLFMGMFAFAPLSAQSKSGKAKSDAGMKFFKGSWAELLEAAKAQNKPIFVDAYAVWCGPCKLMTARVFPQPEVGAFYNKNYINYKIDAEKGEGRTFAKQYGVQAFPTMFYLNPDGEVLHKIVGAREALEFINEGRKGLADPKKLKKFDKEYQGGKRDAAFMNEYINLLWATGDSKLNTVAGGYFNGLSQKERMSPEVMSIVFNVVDNVEGVPFEILWNNKQAFVNEFGAQAVNDKFTVAASRSLQPALQNKNEALLNKCINVLKVSGHPKAAEYAILGKMNFAKVNGDWKKYRKQAVKYVKGYAMNQPDVLNNIAWDFYENVDKRKFLKKALAWSKRSVDLKDDYYNNDTMAALLYKLGKKDEALKAAENAIAIAKRNRQDYSATAKLLKLIKGN